MGPRRLSVRLFRLVTPNAVSGKANDFLCVPDLQTILLPHDNADFGNQFPKTPFTFD
jgi:hypothetical protein